MSMGLEPYQQYRADGVIFQLGYLMCSNTNFKLIFIGLEAELGKM